MTVTYRALALGVFSAAAQMSPEGGSVCYMHTLNLSDKRLELLQLGTHGHSLTQDPLYGDACISQIVEEICFVGGKFGLGLNVASF